MFYLCDLYKGTSIAFHTQESLLYYWREHIDRDGRHKNFLNFDQLNVTGKDEMVWSKFYSAGPWFYTERYRDIRRYQVFDDDGRSIDIRQWKDALAAVESGRYHPLRKKRSVAFTFRDGPVPYVRKSHGHRIGCESFYRSSLQALNDAPLEDLDIHAIVDHTGVRKRHRKLKFSSWDNAEVKAAGKWNRRCWKNSCKALHQWAKHKKGFSRNVTTEFMLYEDDADWDAFCLEALYD